MKDFPFDRCWMPGWYRGECWKVSCDLLTLEGSPSTCGRQTIFQRYDISIICPQDMSCSVCLMARGYEWQNRKCWKASAAWGTVPGRPPRAGLTPGEVEICTVLVTVAGRAASWGPASAPCHTVIQVPSPGDRATWFSIIAQVSIHTASHYCSGWSDTHQEHL